MRFFQSFAIAALSILAGCVSAQSNPIIFPGSGDAVPAGQPVTIRWNPTTSGSVTLTLRFGDSKNLAAGPPIVVNVPNKGEYTWDVPPTIGSGSWSIEIKDSSGNINYSPMFQITGGTGTQGATGITSTKTFASTSGTATSTSTGTSSTSSSKTTGTSSSSSSSSSSTLSTAAQTSTRSATSAPSAGVAVTNVVGGRFAAAIGLGALVVLA